MLVWRLHGRRRSKLQCEEHLPNPWLVRKLGPPPRGGGRSGSPPAAFRLHGPGRDFLFGDLYVAQSGRMLVPCPGLHAKHGAQLHRDGHAGQLRGLVVVHRPGRGLHVAHGVELLEHCQCRVHRCGANADLAGIRVRVPSQWLYGLHRDHLHALGNRQPPIGVCVQHSWLPREYGQELQSERHRERRLDVHLRRLRLPELGRE